MFKKTAFLGISHRREAEKKGNCTSTVLVVLSCGAVPEMMKM